MLKLKKNMCRSKKKKMFSETYSSLTDGNMKSAELKELNYQFKTNIIMKTKTSIIALTKAFFILLVNGWRSVNEELPLLDKQVLCYWNEYGEDVYIICKLTKRQNGVMFEGWDVLVSHTEVTHWKYLPKPACR